MIIDQIGEDMMKTYPISQQAALNAESTSMLFFALVITYVPDDQQNRYMWMRRRDG